MKENYIKLSHQLIFLLGAATAVITPLFFLPITSEFFEFNKFTLLVVVTVLGFLLWAARMVLEKKFILTRTPLDIPLLVLTVVFFIASLTSIDNFTSLVGPLGRPWPSFFALGTLTAFYFVTTSNLKTRKQAETILALLVGSTTIAAFLAISSYFGSYLPFDFAKTHGFSPLGLANRLAALESLVIPVSLYFALNAKTKPARYLSLTAAVLMIFSIILIANMPAFIALGLASAVFLAAFLKPKMPSAAKITLLTLAITTVVFAIMRFVPPVSQNTLGVWIKDKNLSASQKEQVQTPQEVTVPQKIGWDIATQTIGKRPFFGTGPGTYQFVYTQLKPRYVNNTTSWLVRFEKSSSDFTELIATTGIIGTLSLLFLVLMTIRYLYTLNKSKHSRYYQILVPASVAGLVLLFLTTASISTIIPFFLGLALVSTIAKSLDESYVYDVAIEIAALKNKFSWLPIGGNFGIVKVTEETKGTKSQVLPIAFLALVIIASFFALRYQINAYRAEYFFRQSLLSSRSGNGNRTIEFLQKAITANPSVDTYHRILAQTTLNAALSLSQKDKDLTEDDKKLLNQLILVSIDQAKLASGYNISPLRLPGISAFNVANWETLASVYQTITGSVGGNDVHAVNSLSKAINLDPQNPILHDRLGLLYQSLNNLDLAQRKFEDSVLTKVDYGPGYYHLSKVLIDKKGSPVAIVDALTQAKRFLQKDDPAMGDIEKQLAVYNKQLEELQKQQATQQPQASPSPVVTSPAPSPSPPAGGSPSPSPTPSPSPSPSL